MSTESFSPEKVTQLKRLIHDHLQTNGVYQQIRDILSDFAVSENLDLAERSPDALLALIEERGVLNRVLSSFDVTKLPPGLPEASRRMASTSKSSSSHRYLHVQVVGGRAFLDNMDVDVRLASQYRHYIQLHFGSQRFRTGMVECVCEPPFDDDFMINLEKEMQIRKVKDYLALNVPLHVLVLRYDTTTYTSTYVGENTVEWRKVLPGGRISLSVELGSGSGIGVAAGIVNIDMQLLGSVQRQYSEDDVAQYLASERTHTSAAEREFVLYAKRWWNEFQGLHPMAAQRKVKVFVGVSSNSGVRMVPVTTLVQPMRTGRLLSSPMEAARFVSLISMNDSASAKSTDTNLTGGDLSVKSSQLAFLCTRQGDIHNHSLLLCSLLLGFGVDAYCVTGTRHDSPEMVYMWVMTRTAGGVTFWDPMTGSTTVQRNGLKSPLYSRVWSAFNHVSFFANALDDDSVESCTFDFYNDAMWKPMNPVKIRLVAPETPVPLLDPTVRYSDVEERIEDAMLQLISEHRSRLGLSTAWDDEGGYMLAPSLSMYETSRLVGEALPALHQELFQSAMRNRIPDNHTFKGFPVSSSCLSPSRLMHHIMSNTTGRDVLETVGDDVQFMLRVKVTMYPEDVASVWCMVAVRYKTIVSRK